MFLRRLHNLLSNDKITLNNIFNRYIGSVNLLEKWKNKFEEEKIPEVQSSLKIILAHVLNVKKVCIEYFDFKLFYYYELLICIFSYVNYLKIVRSFR